MKALSVRGGWTGRRRSWAPTGDFTVALIHDDYSSVEGASCVPAIGLSNFNITQMEEILSYAKIVPAVNQVELHPFWRQHKLVQYCHSKGIHLSAHTPLGIPGGRASGPASSCEDAVESPAASIVYSRSRSVHAPMLKSHVVAEIAEHLARTPAQVILRWGVQRGNMILFMAFTMILLFLFMAMMIGLTIDTYFLFIHVFLGIVIAIVVWMFATFHKC